VQRVVQTAKENQSFYQFKLLVFNALQKTKNLFTCNKKSEVISWLKNKKGRNYGKKDSRF